MPVRSRTFRRSRFVAAVSSPPLRRVYTSSPAISSRVHFVACRFVAGKLRRLPFRRGDTSSPAVSSQGRFVAGARRRRWICLSSKTTWRTVCKSYLYIVYAPLVIFTIDIINYVTGIGNGSCAHVDTVRFVTSLQCCAGLQQRNCEREGLFR